jgi:hypothetical protein
VTTDGRRAAAEVDGLLVAIDDADGAVPPAMMGQCAAARPTRHSPPPSDIAVVLGWWPLTALQLRWCPESLVAPGGTEASAENCPR